MHYEAGQESLVQVIVHWAQEVKTDSPSTPSPWIKIKLKIKIKENLFFNGKSTLVR